jgi:peptide/nickel transport system substrate-binding protein
LAEEVESSPDAKTWTIRLVEGATFHDGAPVTAEDVQFTLERLRDPSVEALYADVLTFMEGSEMRVMDPRTLRITLQEGYGDFASVLADPGPNILPKTFDPATANTAPIGSGPFRFESFTPGTESTFVRNENYWKEGYPFVDELIITDIPDESARNNALLGGQVDLVVNIGYSSAEVLEAGGAKVIEIPGTTILPIVCVVDMEPFTNASLREALALAIDRPTVVDIVYKGYGRVGNDQPISDSYPYHPVGIVQREQDIPRAIELLAEAGYPDGIDLTMITGDASPGMLDLATVVADQVAEAGIRITLQRHPTDTFWDEVWLKEAFYTSAWTQKSTPDLFLGRTITSGASWNETHLSDPEIDRLLAEARANADPDERTRLYTDAMQRVHDAACWIIVGYGSLLHAGSQGFSWETLPPPLSAPHLFNASVQ